MQHSSSMYKHKAAPKPAVGPTQLSKAWVCGHVRPLRQPVAALPSRTTQTAQTQQDSEQATGIVRIVQRAASHMLASVVAASLVLTPAVQAQPIVVRLPASSNPEIFAAQRTLVEAWTIVGESFVDPTFNQHDWLDELKDHMIAAYKADEAPTKAWEEINAMLSDLGDPYTRRIDQEDYQMFRVSADGELQGIGLLIANELTSSGHLRVLAPIKGGPADRAGILPGDEVISINGQDTKGWSGERAAKLLRGQGGTEVRVRLARRTDGIPGVASRPEPNTDNPVQLKDVALKREAVAISPVYSTLLAPSAGGPPVGYIRLSQFSGNAADDMRKALSSLQGQGAGRYILDLRSNPGGLVRAGVDITGMWLDGEQPVFSVASREDGTIVQTTERGAPALSHAPLVVLVDQGSASASEIVSGALRDNHRALIMGDSATYGKGRIQSVYELQDGSALFVTVAKYLTPAGSDIDTRGIKPDRACRIPVASNPLRAPTTTTASAPPLVGGEVLGTPVLQNRAAMTTSGMQQPTSSPAAAKAKRPITEDSGFVPGIPLDNTTEELLLDALARDRCVLAAERYLEGLQPVLEEPGAPPLTKAQTLYLALTGGNRATM